MPNTHSKEEHICEVCGTSNTNNLLQTTDKRYGNPGIFNYRRCRNCGMLSQDPIPARETIDSFYPTEYYAFHSSIFSWPSGLRGEGFKLSLKNKGYSFRVKHKRAAVLYSIYYRYMYNVACDIPQKHWGSRYLDFGSGSNGTVSFANALGWKASGLDPSKAAVVVGQNYGLDIQYGTAQDHNWEPETFDFIYSHHSFEHIADPLQTLIDLKTLLQTGGRLLIVQPNASGFCAQFGNSWGGLAAPLHIHLHTPKSMRILASQSGFTVEFQKPRANSQDVLDTFSFLMRASSEKRRLISSRAARLAIMPLLRLMEARGLGCDLVTQLKKTN